MYQIKHLDSAYNVIIIVLFVITTAKYVINVWLSIHYSRKNVWNAHPIVWNVQIKMVIILYVINVLRAIVIMEIIVKNVAQIVKYATMRVFILLDMVLSIDV